MQKTDKKNLTVPLVAVLIGVAYLIAGILGDRAGFGIGGFVLMTVVGGAFWLLRHRSETVKGLIDHGDERINTMDLRATAFVGAVVIVAILAAFVVEVARGNDGSPYSWLGFVSGVAYVAALIFQRLRG